MRKHLEHIFSYIFGNIQPSVDTLANNYHRRSIKIKIVNLLVALTPDLVGLGRPSLQYKMNGFLALMRLYLCVHALFIRGVGALGESEGKGEVEDALMDW